MLIQIKKILNFTFNETLSVKFYQLMHPLLCRNSNMFHLSGNFFWIPLNDMKITKDLLT